jgi:two-component system sensor histidine kinase RegB
MLFEDLEPTGGEPEAGDDTRSDVDLPWLWWLRTAAIAAQISTIVLVRLWLEIQVPLAALAAVVTLEIASNLALPVLFTRWPRRRLDLLTATFVFDIICLTTLLYLTGGPSNPFNFLYLVYLALAAVTLSARRALALTALSSTCLGLLFWHYRPLPGLDHGSPAAMALHFRGMWVAASIAGVFIVYFVERVTRALARRDAELAEIRAREERGRHLVSLATLAAGAAHELSTPLATIAVVARELERKATDPSMREDLRLIREQVDRCQGLLADLSLESGQPSADVLEPVTITDLLRDLGRGLPFPDGVEIEIDRAIAGRALHVPRRNLRRVLDGLLKNAAQAASPGIQLRVFVESEQVVFEIEDHGSGMTGEILERVGEPFFSTKAPGEGMGLGIFVARSLFESLGGALEIVSHQHEGTTVRGRLPTRLLVGFQTQHPTS